jgi:TfoX/Sxy family transcriptional regulator of competence genes
VLPAISLQIKSYEEDRPAESTRLRAGYGKTTVRDQFTGQILVMMRIFIFLSMRKQEYMKIRSEWR